MSKTMKVNAADSLPVGMQLALAGGLIDAYTYVNRGNVFATGQTGNLVLIGIRIADKNFYDAFMAAVPILFFVMGVFAYQFLKNKLSLEKKEYWQSYILIFEVMILFMVGFLPSSVPDVFANAPIAFASALQFCSFRVLVNGPYATVFCTGNLRSCAELYYKGLVQKNEEAMKSANRYSLVIGSFLTGGIAATLLSEYFAVKTVWIACMILMFPLVYLVREGSRIQTEES